MVNDKRATLYKHDCRECVFLGSLDEADLYYHPDLGPLTETVIARMSSDGPNYSSGLAFSRPYVDAGNTQRLGNPLLVEARKRAEALGLHRDTTTVGEPPRPLRVERDLGESHESCNEKRTPGHSGQKIQ